MNAWMRKTAALLLAITAPVQAQTTVYYIHTDALGSVVAETDANRNVVERREYEPYGAQLTPALADGPGYTGHVQDAATGLVYMQQRYYDPVVGRFLSTDPVSSNLNDGQNFARYNYAYGSPYKFIDPDGRLGCTGSRIRSVCDAAQTALIKAAVSAGESMVRTASDATKQKAQEVRDHLRENDVVVSGGVTVLAGAPVKARTHGPSTQVMVNGPVVVNLSRGQVGFQGAFAPLVGVGGGFLLSGELAGGP